MSFHQDIIDLLNGQRGGHVQKWLYAGQKRRAMQSGSTLWHKMVTANDNYYPIRAEIKMIPALLRRLTNDFDTIVDFGIGDSRALKYKTLPILKMQEQLQRYYAIDISSGNLSKGISLVKKIMPLVEANSVQGDFYADYFSITGKQRLGLILGSTVSNVDMRIGDEFPRADVVGKLRALAKTLKGGDVANLIVSFDSNPDLDHAMAAYQHPAWAQMMTGLMYDIERALKPTGNFDPEKWSYKGVIDYKNHVLHQTVQAEQDQEFSIKSNHFKINKGELFVVNNNFKYPIDWLIGMIEEAGMAAINAPLTEEDHPMVMVEAAV